VPQERSEHPARSEDRYREQWRWDRVATVTHCLDCYPESCPFKAYVRDGVVLREEQSGIFPTVEPGVPDMNPAGCQKGVAWSQLLHAPERVLYPLRRIGERGEGKWQRVSWDEALKQVADGIIDAIQESGPDAVIHEGTPAQGGLMAGILFAPIARSLGIVATDVNANINDFGPGLYLTFGKFNSVGSSDDWFHSELVLITCANPVYTWMSTYHFIAEARYNGAEVVTIAPDCSPSTAHARRRRRAGPFDVSRRGLRTPLQPGLHHPSDRPAPAGPRGQPPLPPRLRLGGGRPGRPVLLVADRDTRAGTRPAGHPRHGHGAPGP
jgi:nitrate reductase alpha subunit